MRFTSRSVAQFTSMIAIPCAAFLLVGCAMFAQPPEQPTADVRGVSVASVSLSGIDGSAQLDIFNPNNFSVPLRRVDWHLSIGSARAASGSFDLSEHIPARASAPVDVTVSIGSRDAIDLARALASGERSYHITGTMSFSTALGAIDVSFTGTGELQMPSSLLSRTSLPF